jgi:HNH endonuclease
MKINDFRPRDLDGLKEKLGRSYTVNETGCHVFIGTKSERGYGKIAFRRKHYRAHRISYELHKGKIMPGFFVCHKCDNTSCINPDHLFLGTAKDNALDRKQKGRGNNQYTIVGPK